MLIYIIRHGETNLNVEGGMQGSLDEPLNENGRLLASITGKKLRNVKFDSCISSPLQRSVETTSIILKKSYNFITISYDKRLQELTLETTREEN